MRSKENLRMVIDFLKIRIRAIMLWIRNTDSYATETRIKAAQRHSKIFISVKNNIFNTSDHQVYYVSIPDHESPIFSNLKHRTEKQGLRIRSIFYRIRKVKNFLNRIRILRALTKNQFKQLNFVILLRILKIFYY